MTRKKNKSSPTLPKVQSTLPLRPNSSSSSRTPIAPSKPSLFKPQTTSQPALPVFGVESEVRGGIVCRDTSAINEQKKVGKYILKTLGKNVIQNKGLLNLSAGDHLQTRKSSRFGGQELHLRTNLPREDYLCWRR